MLVIGAFVGRPGGLILIGLLAIPPLLVTSAVDNFHWDNPHTITPATASAVQDRYDLDNGKLTIDLRQLKDPEALAGREIDVSMGVGEVIVYVPRSLSVDVTASLSAAGDVEVGGHNQGGLSPTVDASLRDVEA